MRFEFERLLKSGFDKILYVEYYYLFMFFIKLEFDLVIKIL